jgi:hypothetical protein
LIKNNTVCLLSSGAAPHIKCCSNDFSLEVSNSAQVFCIVPE